MAKADLIKRLAPAHPDLLQQDRERIFDTVLETITVVLWRAQRIELHGFGSFSVRDLDPPERHGGGLIVTMRPRRWLL